MANGLIVFYQHCQNTVAFPRQLLSENKIMTYVVVTNISMLRWVFSSLGCLQGRHMGHPRGSAVEFTFYDILHCEHCLRMVFVLHWGRHNSFRKIHNCTAEAGHFPLSFPSSADACLWAICMHAHTVRLLLALLTSNILAAAAQK